MQQSTENNGDIYSLEERLSRIEEQQRVIAKRLKWMIWGGYIRVCIILAPLILGAVYLVPLLREVWQQLQMLLLPGGGGGEVMLQELITQLQLLR